LVYGAMNGSGEKKVPDIGSHGSTVAKHIEAIGQNKTQMLGDYVAFYEFPPDIRQRVSRKKNPHSQKLL